MVSFDSDCFHAREIFHAGGLEIVSCFNEVGGSMLAQLPVLGGHVRVETSLKGGWGCVYYDSFCTRYYGTPS